MDITQEIKTYCKANNLDYNKILNKIIKNGFSIEKYGVLSKEPPPTPKPVIKTVKEYVTDDTKITELVEKLKKVELERDELKLKINELSQEIENIKNNKRDIYDERF